jgi:hypothetical protein
MPAVGVPQWPVDRAFEEMTASFERYCLAAGLEALGAMMEADAPAEVLVGEVAAVRQIGGEQVLERCAPDSAGRIRAEQVLDLGQVDAGRVAGLGGVAVEVAHQGLAPLRAPRPGDQAIEFVRGCHAVISLRKVLGRQHQRAEVWSGSEVGRLETDAGGLADEAIGQAIETRTSVP